MSESGHFYVIQLMPEAAPTWLKLGYTTDIAQRLRSHQTTCPTAKVIHTWPCLLRQERPAMKAMTSTVCQKMGVEVFICTDLDTLLLQGEQFFAQPYHTKQQPSSALVNDRGRARVYLFHLKSWRVAKGLSQDELAKHSTIAASTIIKLERQDNAANLKTIAKLADGLGITRHQLVYEQPAEPGHERQEGDTKTRVVA